MAWGRLFGDRYKAVLVEGADFYHYRENGVSVQILTEFTSVLSLQHATEPAYRISRRLLPRDGAWQPT
jgi:hypothetical protein